MEKKYRLEPFDVERAKAGEPVCTRSGQTARVICWNRNSERNPIIGLIGEDEEPVLYTIRGSIYYDFTQTHPSDLMMKVEVKESYVYAEVAGIKIPFDDVKSKGLIKLKSLEFLIIKTYDDKFLKIWKRDLPEQEWKEAQKIASAIGDGWRCPTRHECIDIYDARFKGLDDAMEEIGGESLKEIYWTSEADSAPQYGAGGAVCFGGDMGDLYPCGKFGKCSVRPVCEIK